MKLLLGILMCLLLVGCGAPADHPGTRASVPAPPDATATTATSSPTDSAPTGPEAVVRDPRAALAGVRVHRAGDRLAVASVWSRCRRGSCKQAIAISRDGFETARYLPASQRNWQRLVTRGVRPPTQAEQRAVSPRLAQPVPSLARVHALLGGGDGATLLPFEQAARSEDGGASWATYDVAEVDGARAYVAGGVALRDGRLLVLLDHWSGDRNGKPSGPFHGLWASDGDDWSTYGPVRPAFRPALSAEPRGGSALTSLSATPSDRLVTATTWDGRAYVSTDGAQTFREVATR